MDKLIVKQYLTQSIIVNSEHGNEGTTVLDLILNLRKTRCFVDIIIYASRVTSQVNVN